MVRSVDDVANKSPAGANEMSLMTYGFGAPQSAVSESDSSTRSRTRSAAVVQAARPRTCQYARTSL
jgi:hypothetical protein